MEEQPISSAELDQILDLGLDHTTHQATLRKAAREVMGRKFVGDAYRELYKALERREAERQTARTGYVAVRRMTLLGQDYLPGDPVPMDRMRPNLRRLLITSRKIRAEVAQ